MEELIIKWYGLDLSKGRSWLWPNSWGWIRILIPCQKRFYKWSCIHDYLYWEWFTEDGRSHADKSFLYINTECCDNYLQLCLASLYYKLVRRFWYLYFNYEWWERKQIEI